MSNVPILAGTMQTDPRSGGVKRSSGVNVLPVVNEGTMATMIMLYGVDAAKSTRYYDVRFHSIENTTHPFVPRSLLLILAVWCSLLVVSELQLFLPSFLYLDDIPFHYFCLTFDTIVGFSYFFSLGENPR
jgi:hypothetical protein